MVLGGEGGFGVRGWPDPGGRCTRTPDPGSGHTVPHQGAGKGSSLSGPEWMGGPHKIYFMVKLFGIVN
jgi:hypothetical protein